jgi:hypothetical protein
VAAGAAGTVRCGSHLANDAAAAFHPEQSRTNINDANVAKIS